MATTITALPLDATAKTAAGAEGYYAALNSTASWLALAGGSNIVTLANNGSDGFPTKQTANNNLGGQYQGLAFWESQTPDRLIFKSGTTLHWMNETVNGYVFSGDIITSGTGMSSQEIDLLDIPGTQHLADSGYGTTYIWGIDEGNYPNSPINPPQEYNMGGQYWYGVRYSPDGNYVACMNNSGSSLRILKRNGDTYSHLTVPANASVLAGYCDFSEDSKQIAIGGQNAGQPGIRVYNIDTATDTVTLDPVIYGDTTKACIPLYCGAGGNILLALNKESTNHKAYAKVGATLTEDPTVVLTAIPKVSYAQKASARPEIISLAHPSPDGYGVYKVQISEALTLNASGFVGPMGKFDALAKLTAQIEDAGFVGPMGSFDTLLASPAGDPTIETIRQGTAQVLLEGGIISFSDIAPTFQAIVASFRGPFGHFDARIVDHPEIEAGFVGPGPKFDAVLYEGNIITAEFLGPFGHFDAELEVEVPLSIEAGFVGPSSAFSVELQHFSVEAGFVGPHGGFAANLLGNDGVWAGFVGPFGSFEAELNTTLPLEANFVGPFGGFDASLGEDFRSMNADFVGPFGHFDAELYTPEALSADFVGPFGSFAAGMEVHEEITASFVGPFGRFDALITRGPRLDAFFVGPHGHFDVQLDEVYPSTEGEFDITYKKRTSEMTGAGDPNSTLTFILIQP